MRKQKSDKAFENNYNYIYEIVTIAIEQYFILFALNKISCISKDFFNIHFIKSVLKKNSEEKKQLYKNVKQVIKVIVNLLNNRVNIKKKLVMKRQQVLEYLKNRSNYIHQSAIIEQKLCHVSCISLELCIYFLHILIKIFSW